MANSRYRRFLACVLVSLLTIPTNAASIVVRQLPDTKAGDEMSRADLLARKGYYPQSCEGRKVCTFSGLGGEVWVWEGYAQAMLMQGKTLLFRGKCQSACYLAYLEAVKIDPKRVKVAPGTVFYKHKPYTLRQ